MYFDSMKGNFKKPQEHRQSAKTDCTTMCYNFTAIIKLLLWKNVWIGICMSTQIWQINLFELIKIKKVKNDKIYCKSSYNKYNKKAAAVTP